MPLGLAQEIPKKDSVPFLASAPFDSRRHGKPTWYLPVPVAVWGTHCGTQSHKAVSPSGL